MTYPILPGYIDLAEAVRRAGSLDRLLGWLSPGVLIFSLVERDGTPHPIDKQFWLEADVATILEEGYVESGPWKGRLQINLDDFQRAGADVWAQSIPGKRAERVRRQQAASISEITAQRSPTRRTGAPEKYDWEAMWIEIVWMMQEADGLPATDLELRKKMQLWFSDRSGDAPGDNMIRPKLDRLYKRLGRKPQ